MKRWLALLLAALLVPLCAFAEAPVGLGYTASTAAGLRMTAVSVTESRGSWNTPAPGTVFVIVTFRVENASGGDVTLSTVMDFEAFADGRRVDWSQNGMLACDWPIDGTVSAGRQAEGQVGWEVPEGWQSLEIHYRPGGWGSALSFGLSRSDLGW